MPNEHLEQKVTSRVDPQGKRTSDKKVLLWKVLLYAPGIFFIVRGFQAFSQAPTLAVPLGVALIWAGLLALPPAHLFFRRLSQAGHIGSRAALAVIPVLCVATMIASKPDPSVDQAVSSVPSPGGAAESQPAPPLAFVKRLLEPRLRDPQSATYSDVVAYKLGERLTFCGLVNAKNGFGGYAGAQPFVISDDGIFLGDQVTVDRTSEWCRGTSSPMRF